jgi:hypothetical protein
MSSSSGRIGKNRSLRDLWRRVSLFEDYSESIDSKSSLQVDSKDLSDGGLEEFNWDSVEWNSPDDRSMEDERDIDSLSFGFLYGFSEESERSARSSNRSSGKMLSVIF